MAVAEPTAQRATGVVLYTLAAVLLAAGLWWWVWSAPDVGEDPRMKAWREAVKAAVPDRPDQHNASTEVLQPGPSRSAGDSVSGSFQLTLSCAGEGVVQVKVNAPEGPDMTVPCAEVPPTVTEQVSLTGSYLIEYVAQGQHPVVFRWRLAPG